jgi:hypothetical protein
MAHEFEKLALDGHNYLILALDVKISLAFHGIMTALTPPAERERERQYFWIPSSTRHYTSSVTTSILT